MVDFARDGSRTTLLRVLKRCTTFENENQMSCPAPKVSPRDQMRACRLDIHCISLGEITIERLVSETTLTLFSSAELFHWALETFTAFYNRKQLFNLALSPISYFLTQQLISDKQKFTTFNFTLSPSTFI